VAEAGRRRSDGRADARVRDTRERVRAVAAELFVAKGFSHTTLQDIADRLELTKAALYYHYPTKADLVRSVVQPAVDDVEALLTEADRAEMPPRELLERFFDLHHTHRMVFLALVRDPTGLAEADADNWVPRLAQRFQELLAGPEATHEQRIRAVIAANGLSRCATLLTDIPHDELRTTTVNVALEIIGTPDQAQTI
jgi:AcrR family transcriptional regulator